MDQHRLSEALTPAAGTGPRRRHGPRRAGAVGATLAPLLAALLAACGAGDSNPIDNPPAIQNGALTATGQKLSFEYFQRCINPIFEARLQINQGGQLSTNTCAAAGCHDNTSGTGGAFRVRAGATVVDLAAPGNTPAVVRNTDMYRNYYSAQGEVVLAAPLSSRLLVKPLILNVLHGGGQIFDNLSDPNVLLIQYWITHPMPTGQDEFSTAANNMFEGQDPKGGKCKII